MKRNKNIILILTLLLVSFITYDLYARGGRGGGARGGGGHVSRSSPARGGSMHSSKSYSRGATSPSGSYSRGAKGSPTSSTSVGRGGSPKQYKSGTSNRHGDININKNVNVNVNKKYYNRGGHSHRYYDHYNAGAFAAGLIVGTAITASVYSSAYPSGCVATFVGNTTYYQCGTTWYQREYASSGTTYIVVNDPN
jgi:hypothetical protein